MPKYWEAVQDLDPYVDDGTVAVKARHGAPTGNTTRSSNSVKVEMPSDLMTTARIYRTTNPTNWNSSLVDWVGYSPFTDTGHGTRRGVPPQASSGVSGAPKIDLTDLAEVEGRPSSGTLVVTIQADFTFAGPVQPGYGVWPWINELDHCELWSARCSLGVGSVPAAQDVIVTFQRRLAGSATWEDVHDEWGSDPGRVEVPVGTDVGALTLFSTLRVPTLTLNPGDALRPVIIQSGGGATPTDRDLTVNVTMVVRHGPDDANYIWETS